MSSAAADYQVETCWARRCTSGMSVGKEPDGKCLPILTNRQIVALSIPLRLFSTYYIQLGRFRLAEEEGFVW